MKPETLDKMVNLIYRADKEELNTLWQAMKLQHEALRAQAAADAMRTLRVGDKVRITHIRPKSWVGRTGTITRRRQVKFEVRMDDSLSTAIIPAVCLEKID